MVEEKAAALNRRGIAARLLALSLALLLAVGSAFAAPPKKTKNPSWAELSTAQQKILAPLAGEWDRLDATNRTRWLGVAKRFPKMTPIGQKRVQTRMRKWAALTPAQREEAREKYKRMRMRKDLKTKWQQYKSLPPTERQSLVPKQDGAGTR